MKALSIGAAELRRMFRDRTNLFFVFLFPVILILLLGATFGGDSTPKVGLYIEDEGSLTSELVGRLESEPSLSTERRADRSEMLTDVERGLLEAALIVPPGYSSSLSEGRNVELTFVSKPGDFSAATRSAIEGVINEQSAAVRAALVAQDLTNGSFQDTHALATEVGRSFAGTDVSVSVAGSEEDHSEEGQFDTGASTQLILFTFVNSLAGSVALVQTRQHGVLRRMLAAPVSTTTILAGETLGRLFVALLQGTFIVAAASLLFGVHWGDPLGAGAVVALFALVSTGAAMLAGSVLKNDSQAGALVPFGLALAALGGCMVPLEVFPGTMRTIARVTPHAWANDAFERLIGHGESLSEIAPQLAVLAAFAAVFLIAGSWGLRRSLTT